MSKSRFVSYLRVSTARQGASGLGLEAQRAAVSAHLNGGNWTLLREIVEVESGKRNDRPALAEALRLCRQQKATLVIAKLDRLARNVHFISGLMESGVEFLAVDMPSANRFVVHIPGGSRGAGSRGHQQANEGGSRCSQGTRHRVGWSASVCCTVCGNWGGSTRDIQRSGCKG